MPMSQTSEMRNLAIHAADKLRGRIDGPEMTAYNRDTADLLRRAKYDMAYAEAILRMIATCMEAGDDAASADQEEQR